MQPKVKSNSVVTSAFDEGANTITFTVVGAGSTVLKLNAISDAVRVRAIRHGLGQRVADRAAKNRDTADGKPASPATKLAAMAALVDHYNSGADDWNLAGAGGSGPGLDGVLLAAIAEVTGKGLEAIRALVAAGSEKHGVTQRAYLAKLATGKAVAPIVDRMRAEAAEGVDPEGELAELMGEEE